MVFDRYLPTSIKEVTRAERKTGKSKGIRRDVESRDNELVTGTGLLSLKKTRQSWPFSVG